MCYAIPSNGGISGLWLPNPPSRVAGVHVEDERGDNEVLRPSRRPRPDRVRRQPSLRPEYQFPSHPRKIPERTVFLALAHNDSHPAGRSYSSCPLENLRQIVEDEEADQRLLPARYRNPSLGVGFRRRR